MNTKKISNGTVHTVPFDLKEFLISNQEILTIWETLTPLSRNEYICWITSAKKIETRNKRIKIMSENLLKGKRRPCCFPGCSHR